MALIMIGVRKSSDPRAGIQNGFWGIKYLLIIGGMIGAFFIPEGSFGKVTVMRIRATKELIYKDMQISCIFGSCSGTVWMYFGFIGAFLFILIQLVLIIDFAHSWAELWVGNYEETEQKGWLVLLLASTGT